MAQRNNHHVKRLQHGINSFDSHRIQNLNNQMKYFQPFKPAPYRARRGNARVNDRHRYISVPIPKSTINYDLAESFTDHSTNSLSSDLYKIRFKHSAKQWPNGRFINYKEKLDKLDGQIMDITCIRTFPIVSKRKKLQERENQIIKPTSTVVLIDPIIQEQKKRLADKQTNFYANLFGCAKFSKISITNQIKKTNDISNSTKSFISNSLVGENKEDQQC